MEEKGHAIICNTDTGRSIDKVESLALSPHRSRRLEEKAKALNKSRLSLEDLLYNVDKRNEKFGFISTSIGSHISDHSLPKSYSSHQAHDSKTSRRSLMVPSSLVYEHCKSISNFEEVFYGELNSDSAGDLHKRRRTYSERAPEFRVSRQKNLKTESSEGVRETSKSWKIRDSTAGSLLRARSCANLSELQYLDVDNIRKNKISASAISNESERKELDDRVHPVSQVESFSIIAKGSSDNQVEGHLSKDLNKKGLDANSVSRLETTTMRVAIENQAKVSCDIAEETSRPSQQHKDQLKNLTTSSVLESESANESNFENKLNSFLTPSNEPPFLIDSVIESKLKSCVNELPVSNDSVIESQLKSNFSSPHWPSSKEGNSSNGKGSCTDDIMIIEEKGPRAYHNKDARNQTKIAERNFNDSSALMRVEESASVLLLKKSLDKMAHTVSTEKSETDHPEQVMSEHRDSSKSISVSPSSKQTSSLYHCMIARDIKISRSGLAVINVVKSEISPKTTILIKPIEKPANTTAKATVVEEIVCPTAISGGDSECKELSKKSVTREEIDFIDEDENFSTARTKVNEERKETRIFTPKSVKKHLSFESPEVIYSRIVPRSREDLLTNSTTALKYSSERKKDQCSRNSSGNAAVRNLFIEDKSLKDLNLLTNECIFVKKVDQDDSSMCGQENYSCKVSEAVEKSDVEEVKLSSQRKSSPKVFKTSNSSVTDKLVQKVHQKNSSISDVVDISNEYLGIIKKPTVEELKRVSLSPRKMLNSTESSKLNETLGFDANSFNNIAIPLLSPRQKNTGSFIFSVDEDLDKCEDDLVSRHQKGDYSCGFTGFKDDSQNYSFTHQPAVVLERLPSWVSRRKTVKVLYKAAESKENVQEQMEPRISEEEFFNRKEELQLKRKYKSMSDLSELMHHDLQKEKEYMTERRRITRSFGEEIKVDYLAKLPDERDVRFKKPESDENLPFFGFNIPFGFLGLPDHYLVYRSIIKKGKQLGFQIDPYLGAGNLDERSESLYFMGDCNPFRPRPIIPQMERDRISPTKILEIASVNSKVHSQSQMRPWNGSSCSSSPEKVQDIENLTVEFDHGLCAPSVNFPKEQSPNPSPSNQSLSAVDHSLKNAECYTLNNEAEGNINSEPTGIEDSTCGKAYCRLGCICESLEVRARVKEHCGHEFCMFSSSCCKSTIKPFSCGAKMSILEHIDGSLSEEELIRSKRKRKLPARLIQEENISSPFSLSGKKQCHNSDILLLSEEKSAKMVECRVLLNKFQLAGANIRCMFHFRINCPCLRNSLLAKPRNVAMKSTSGTSKFNPVIVCRNSQTGCVSGSTFCSSERVVASEKASLKTDQLFHQYRSTIIYPQSPSKANESKFLSNGIIDSADSLVMREDLHRGGSLRYFFNNMTEFQRTLSKGNLKCSDLEEICSESLSYLPKGAVQIMKLSLLKEMLRKELAFLWMMHLPRGRAHIFLSKENKAPGIACQRVRDLDELNKLPSLVQSLFFADKNSDGLVSCIQISQSYFWQITGTISFMKNVANKASKTGAVVANITDSKPIWPAGTQEKTMPMGFKSRKFITLKSGNYKVHGKCPDNKKIKVNTPSNSNLFNHSQPAHVAKKSQQSVSSISCPPDSSNLYYRVWYNLNLNRPFDELRVDSKNFKITRLQLQNLYSLARSKKSFVRVLFSPVEAENKKSSPCILANPNEKNYTIKIGPFPLYSPTGVKTYKNVNGMLIETVSYLTLNRVVAREKSPHQDKSNVSSPINLKRKSKFKEVTQNVNKACDVSKRINPKVSDIVSTEDADPGLKIVIQDVQGHYSSFNDIPSPETSVPFEGEIDTLETPSDSMISCGGQLNVNELEMSHEITSNTSESMLTCGQSKESESPASIYSVDSVVNDYSSNVHDSNISWTPKFKDIAARDEVPFDNLRIPNEIFLNYDELILKEEPNSDPLDEHEPLAVPSEEILPDPVETTEKCGWAESKGLKEIVVKNPNVLHSRLSSVPKSTSVKRKSSILGVLKQKRHSGSKRSILKKNLVPPKSITLHQLPIEHGNIETGYLIPDVPGLQPIPVARGGMTELESKAITMKHPLSKDGNLVNILDLGLANLYLNRFFQQKVNFFPNNMKINWTFVKVDGIASKEEFEGLMELRNLTNDMFITPKGVFSYDEAVKSKSALQRCGINGDSFHRFMEARRRRQIVICRKQLADLIPDGRKEKTMIATICDARKEIEKLKAESALLQKQLHNERCIKTSLMTRLRGVASVKERETVMKSLRSLTAKETDIIPSEPIREDGKNKMKTPRIPPVISISSMEDINKISTQGQPKKIKARSKQKRKRSSESNKHDDDFKPCSSKRKVGARKTEDTKSDSKEAHSSETNLLQLKPQASSTFSRLFERQLKMLEKHVISGNIFGSEGLGSSSKYSILNDAESVLAAADTHTNGSSLENEDSILGSGSDVDIETLDDEKF